VEAAILPARANVHITSKPSQQTLDDESRLAGLSTAGVVSAFTVAAEQRYTADRSAWAALLGCEPDELPAHRDWPQLLGALRHILRWSEQPELANMSDYLRASSARDLIETIRPDLAFAGTPTDLSTSPENTLSELEDITESVLITMSASPQRVE
jgi:hypothetical protein